MSISKDALKENTTSWERVGAVSNGGTVFGLAISPVPQVYRAFAATGCGIFYSDDEGNRWIQNLNGLTTPLLSALAVSPNGALFAGALGGDLFSSFDFGKTWNAGLVPAELKATVTAIVASPNFRNDGAAFAGTDGGGVLVSRNSGQSWEDSSFGLGDTSILALATAPHWTREREMMFAATMDGVYVSPNGGRAWRATRLTLDDDVVDVLAVSPHFEHDRTVFAGTEGGRLYCSQDQGSTWKLLQGALGQGPVNCLWLAPDFAESGRMVAGVGSQILVSNDHGASWQVAVDLPGAVLALAGDAQLLLAGLHDAGVFKSTDRGATWVASSDGLSARGFARLACHGDKLFALGPQEGLWISEDEGASWQDMPSLRAYFPLAAMTINASGQLFLASQEGGLLRSLNEGADWVVVSEEQGIQAVSFAPDGVLGWAGTAEGKLLHTQDGGQTWREIASPCEGEEILSLVVSPCYAEDRTILMGTAVPATGNKQARVALWRSTNGGESWRQVTTQVTSARWLDIALPQGKVSNPVEQAILATGPYCLRPLRRAKDVWISTRVDPNGANTLSVIALGDIDEDGLLFAATGTGIYRSIDGGRTWHAFMEGMGSESLISLIAVHQGEALTLYAMSLGGSLWKRAL